MSYYKHITTNILITLCLFGACSEPSLKFRGESCTSAAKWKYFHGFLTFTDGEFTCEMQVMHLGKEHIDKIAHAVFVRAALNSESSLLIHAIY